MFIQTEDEKNQKKEYYKKLKKKQEENKIINQKYEEYGAFIWSIYNISEKTFPQLKPSNITRIMFLSTYLHYDGYLAFSKNKPLSKDDVFQLLKISQREFYNFYNEMIDNKIFYLKDDKIYINEKMFSKGKLDSKKTAEFIQDNKYITRLYIDGVRELYNKSTPRSHKTLSYLFQILPYVNRQYNIVCFNPLETDLKLVQNMRLGEFCEIIKYDKTHAKRLFTILFDPQFKIDGQIKTAMRYVVDKSFDKQTYSMFINPRVYYAGDKWQEVEVLGKF